MITLADIEAIPSVCDDADREAWLDARRKGIGSSDVGNIVCPKLQEHSFGGPWDVLVSKRDGVTLDDNEAMMLGRNLEAGIGAAWAEKHGLRVVKAFMVQHPDEPWALASPDLWALDGDAVIGVPEVKNTQAVEAYPAPDGHGHTLVTRDDVPLKYFLQCQWQRWVLEAALGVRGLRMWLTPLVFGREVRSYEVARDDELLAFAIAECRAFWFDHVIGGEPLPVDGSAECWRALSEGRGDEVRDITEEQADLLDALATTKDRKAAAEREEKRLKARLAETMQGAKSARGERWRVTWSGGGVRRTFDAKAFRKAHPDLAAEFMKEAKTAASLRVTEVGG